MLGLDAVTYDEVCALKELFDRLSNSLHHVCSLSMLCQQDARVQASLSRACVYSMLCHLQTFTPATGAVLVQDGLIHRDEFALALFKTQGQSNLFIDKVFQVFDIKRNDVIDFEEFIHSLSVFHPNAPLEEKAHCTSQTVCFSVAGVRLRCCLLSSLLDNFFSGLALILTR